MPQRRGDSSDGQAGATEGFRESEKCEQFCGLGRVWQQVQEELDGEASFTHFTEVRTVLLPHSQLWVHQRPLPRVWRPRSPDAN